MTFRKQHVGAALLGLVLVGIYWYSANRFPSGYADSDELITTGALLSVAHPPGYSLNVILIHLAQRCLFFLSPAFAANLLAGLLQALSLVIFYYTSLKLIRYIKPSRPVSLGMIVLIQLGCLFIGLSGLFWQYSTIIEVVSLANLLIAVSWFFAVHWITSQTKPFRDIVLTAAFFGLGVSHLQSIIVLGPGLLWLYLAYAPGNWFRKTKQLISIIAIAGIFFLLGNLPSFLLNSRQQAYSWSFDPTISGWWHLITRKDYQGYFIDRNTTQANAYVGRIRLDYLLQGSIHHSQSLWNYFCGLPLLLCVAGAAYLMKQNRKLGWALLGSYLIAGFLFPAYLAPNDSMAHSLDYRLLVGTSERQQLIGYPLMVIFMVFGLIGCSEYFYRFTHNSTYSRLGAIALGVSLLLSMAVSNQKLGVNRNHDQVYQYAKRMLTSAKPNSVIMCTSDFACFSLFYQSLVEKFRPDVVILSDDVTGRRYFLNRHPEYSGFLYSQNPYFIAQEIAWNVYQKRPTYLSSINQFYSGYIGLDSNPFYLIPGDSLFELTTTYPEHAGDTQDSYLDSVLRFQPDRRDYLAKGFLDYLAGNQILTAQLQARLNQLQEATQTLHYSLSLSPNNQEALSILSNLDLIYQQAGYHQKTASSSADYYRLAQTAYQAGDYETAYNQARKAFYLNPVDTQSLSLLFDVYGHSNLPKMQQPTAEHLKVLKQNRWN